ncbi:MAG: CBS domain-containing protein [Candidatus Nezhaarchaeales archaeon]
MGKSLIDQFPSIVDIAYKAFKKRRKVLDIMSKGLVYVDKGTKVLDAARMMGERHIGSVVVRGDVDYIGMFSERDLLSRVICPGLNLEDVEVQQVMSPKPLTIDCEVSVKEGARALIKGKGRLIVLDKGMPVGFLSTSDLVKALPGVEDFELEVKKFMTKSIVTVKPDASVTEAAKIMCLKRIGSVLLDLGEGPYAIFTERDLVTKVVARGFPFDAPLEAYASKPLITVRSDATIHEAALTMALKGIRRLPVTEDDKIVGIITARDLVEAYAK